MVACILGLADFKLEFVTFGGVLEVSGVPLGSILAVWGDTWTCIRGSGRSLWGSRGAPERLRGAVGAWDRLPRLASHHFERFWRTSQNGAKIYEKSIQNSIEKIVGCVLVSAAFWANFGSVIGTPDPQK